MNKVRPQLSQQTDFDVVVIGAGISGLYAAYRLQQANVRLTVLEASDHVGGRVFSRPERHSRLGLTLDEGANLINSTDTLALRLMNNFGIGYVRRLKPGSDSMHYLVSGKEYDQEGIDALLFEESAKAINQIFADQADWAKNPVRDTDLKFIGRSIENYLGSIGAGSLLTQLLEVFFWSEYGHKIDDLNLHVLFDYLEIDLSCPCFKLIPNVDEAFTVPGGAGQIVDRLALACQSAIRLSHQVNRICEANDVIDVVYFDSEDKSHSLSCKQVIFAAPLHSLKNIAVSIHGLTQAALDQARAMTYANGTKLHLKFTPEFHKIYKYTGILLTDTGEQIWPSSTGQGGAGLLTVLTGPLPAGRAAAVEHTGHLLKYLDQVYPGLSEYFVAMERTDAPMSYSGSFRPGEIAEFSIHAGATHWITVGEASGGELQGYLEGALRSADAGVSRYLLAQRMQKNKRQRQS